MDLNNLRKYLDNFDKAICTLLLHRMSLIPLVAETKIENNVPIYQKEREEYMFSKISKFCDDSRFNTKMMVDIYRRIIDEAYVIEDEVISNKKNISPNDEIKRIEKFIEKVSLLNDDNDNYYFEELTKSYKKILNSL